MAKQLNLLATGQVIPTALHAEMQRSYLEYAMSVIVGRALPDVRDGLKPVHRRILYAMHELGLTPDRPYRKCARVVGDVLGKYHPHGDQAVYDALVRLVQDFSSRYPLLAGHGNFGSVDNDPPAAMRYTETRLSPISNEALLSEISEAAVDFIGNFDDSQQEPVVLPAQLPILLLNGCSGIAVGMATNVPPHNLGEVVDGTIALIDTPNLADEKLWELIPGPDFPTGGEIVETSGLQDAYRTGRGSIPLRGVATLEQIQVGRGRRGQRTAIVVSELPYQVNKAGWIEKVAALVNQGRIEGISDLRDESDRRGMRVVIELKRDANPHDVLEHLYRQTPLQSNFGAILLTIVDGQPRQLSLRQVLEEFLRFREQTLTRQYSDELQQKERRLHNVEGLLACLSQLDAVIEILRHAPDGSTAKSSLQQQLNLSEMQAEAILAMPMRRLTGLERQKLQSEFDELSQSIEQLQRLLSNRHELLKAMKKELRSLKRKYADPRRTRILQQSEVTTLSSTSKQSSVSAQQLSIDSRHEEDEEMVVEFTYQGNVQRQSTTNGQKSTTSSVGGDDFVVKTRQVSSSEEFVAITSSGKAYPLRVRDIPPSAGLKQGTPTTGLLPDSAHSEMIVAQFKLPEDTENLFLILLTQQGRIKRLPASELTSLSARGLTLVKLKDDDRLEYINLARSDWQVVLATSNGRILRFEVNDEELPLMGRTAQGNQAMRLGRRDRLVGCVALLPDENLLLVTAQGYGKRMPVGLLSPGHRGNTGNSAIQFKSSNDILVGMVQAIPGSEVALVTTLKVKPIQVDSVKFWGKDSSGDRLIKLKSEERVVNVTPLEIEDYGE